MALNRVAGQRHQVAPSTVVLGTYCPGDDPAVSQRTDGSAFVTRRGGLRGKRDFLVQQEAERGAARMLEAVEIVALALTWPRPATILALARLTSEGSVALKAVKTPVNKRKTEQPKNQAMRLPAILGTILLTTHLGF